MSDVDAYVSKVDLKLRGQFERLRSLVKKALPGITESVKWGVPYYSLDGVGVASIAEYSEHVNLYFLQGAKLSSNLLEGTGKGMRHITMRPADQIKETEITQLLREAEALAAGGSGRKNTRSAKARRATST